MGSLSNNVEGSDGPTTQRLEAFSDGVFSIAITLLVLELAIPESRSPSPPPLRHALAELWPSYLAYVLTFLIVGIYWANHHFIFSLYRRTNHTFNLLNLAFLMSISFLPFPTAVLSRYIRIPDQADAAVMFYAFGLLLPATTFLAIWLYASNKHRLIDSRISRSFIRHLTLQYSASSVIYMGALVAANWNYRLGFGICIALTLLYLLPPRRPQLSDPPDELVNGSLEAR